MTHFPSAAVGFHKNAGGNVSPIETARMEQATIVAVLDREIGPAALESVSSVAKWLEVRADLVADGNASALRSRFGGKLLYTLRTRGQGGESDLSASERRQQLLRAAQSYDYVDLEPDDLGPDILARIPESKRILSWHGQATDQASLAQQTTSILATPAALYRVVPRAETHSQTLLPLQMLQSHQRRNVIAWADGLMGLWTRMVAPHFGAPFVFGTIAGNAGEDGVPTVSQLVTDYGLPHITSIHEIFGIAGDPVHGSLSPRLHNAAFRELGRPALYVPFHVPMFGEFWREVIASGGLDALGLPIKAICVVSPHKESAIESARAHTPMVRRAHSTNFFVREQDGWFADTTDPQSVIVALEERGVNIGKHTVAVVGCGGSGRAIAAALQQAGADVTLVNRGLARGSFAESLLQLPFVPLGVFPPERFSLVVNATPVGRDGREAPFRIDRLRKDVIVVDLVYGDRPTLLISRTRANGQVTVDGRDILMKQAMRQFHLMTGQEMPEPLVRRILGLEVPAGHVVAER